MEHIQIGSKEGSYMKLEMVLIRHAETTAAPACLTGRSCADGLSSVGQKQLESHLKQREYPPVDLLFTSPARCCRETAEKVYPMLVAEVLPGLADRSFGAFEGGSFAALKDRDDYRRWISGGMHAAPPSGESEQDVLLRVKAALRSIARDAADKRASRVAVVTHGNWLAGLLQACDRYEDVPPCGGTIFLTMDSQTDKITFHC